MQNNELKFSKRKKAGHFSALKEEIAPYIRPDRGDFHLTSGVNGACLKHR